MLNAVEIIEDAAENAFLKGVKLMKKYLLAAFKDHIAQRKELLVGNTFIFEAGGILRPAKC